MTRHKIWALTNPGSLSACISLIALQTAFIAQAQTIVSFNAPGADLTPGAYNGTFPASINNLGAVTGSYDNVNDVSVGFLRTAEGSYISFQAPGADQTTGTYHGTSPTGINDLGVITGYYSDAQSYTHGFIRKHDGKFETFEAPGAGGYGTFPIGINLEGDVVGYYTNPNVNFRAFLRKADGVFKTFAGPDACVTGTSTGCYGNEDTAINLLGLSAGNYLDTNLVGHGLIRTPEGKLKTFDLPGGGTGAYQGTGCPGCTSGLNVWGAIAATYTDANNVHHGFIRSPDGNITTYDAPGAGTEAYQGTGCYSDCSVELNDWGVIAGVYIDANDVYHGFLRSPQGKITTIDPQGTQFTLPQGLNDRGVIAGYYLDATNVYHGFLALTN